MDQADSYSGYNLRAQRANLARPDNITHIAPLTHYLTNAVIPGFPNTDQECFDLSGMKRPHLPIECLD